MAVLFEHDWTGSDGNPWDSNTWVIETVGSPSVTIDTENGDPTGRGAISFSTNSDRVIAHLQNPIDTEPTGILVLLRTNNDGQGAHLIFARGSGTWSEDDVTDGYRMMVIPADGDIIIRRYIDADSVNLDTTNFSMTENTDYWLYWEVFEDSGQTVLRYKFWEVGQSEPGTWHQSITDNDPDRPISGSIAVGGAERYGNNTIFFDDITVTDLSSGTTYDETAGAVTALVTTDGVDTLDADEESGMSTVVVTTAGVETLAMDETSGITTVLVVLSGIDTPIFDETAGLVTILAQTAGVDTLAIDEEDGTQTILAQVLGTEVLDIDEMDGTQVVLVVVTGTESMAGDAEGPLFPTSDAVVAEGDRSWVFPERGYTDDGNDVVRLSMDPGETTDNHVWHGFGFTGGATPVGIRVDVEGSGSEVSALTAQLYWNGALRGTSKTINPMPESEAVMTFGGPTDLWGALPSDSDIQLSDFGVALQGENVGPFLGTIAFDYVTITIYYDDGTIRELDGTIDVLAQVLGTDQLAVDETAGVSTVLVIVDGTDELTGIIDETGGVVTVLAAISGDEFQVMTEEGGLVPVLVLTSGQETQDHDETAGVIALLGDVSGDEWQNFDETGGVVIVPIVMSGVEGLVFDEGSGVIQALVDTSGIDTLDMVEYDGVVQVLVEVSGIDGSGIIELDGQVTVLVGVSGLEWFDLLPSPGFRVVGVRSLGPVSGSGVTTLTPFRVIGVVTGSPFRIQGLRVRG